MSKTNRDRSVFWSDLFLGLLYAATVLLFGAWLANIQLPQAPAGMEIFVHAWTSWVGAAGASAFVTAVFKRRAPLLVLVLSMILATLVMVGAYWIRVPRPIGSEHWETTEGDQGQFHYHWDVTFDGRPFDCYAAAEFHGGRCRAFGWGDYRGVYRFESPDNNQCNFFGKISDGRLVADYFCEAKAGRHPFSAVVTPTTP